MTAPRIPSLFYDVGIFLLGVAFISPILVRVFEVVLHVLNCP